MRNHFSPHWEKTLSDERQFCAATNVAQLGLDQFGTWGVPVNYFRRLLGTIFGALAKKFNGTADICTFADNEPPNRATSVGNPAHGSARI